MAITANSLRRGMPIIFQGEPCRVIEFHHHTPGNLRAMVHAKLRKLHTGVTIEHRFRSTDAIEQAHLETHQLQYLYHDGQSYHFMNTESYEQIHLSQEILGDQALYLLPEATISVEFYEDEPVGIHLPQTVDLKVTDTVPGIKGATAAAQVKPATTETGFVVTVPAFINEGDVVRINTETGEYLSRV